MGSMWEGRDLPPEQIGSLAESSDMQRTLKTNLP